MHRRRRLSTSMPQFPKTGVGGLMGTRCSGVVVAVPAGGGQVVRGNPPGQMKRSVSARARTPSPSFLRGGAMPDPGAA